MFANQFSRTLSLPSTFHHPTHFTRSAHMFVIRATSRICHPYALPLYPHIYLRALFMRVVRAPFVQFFFWGGTSRTQFFFRGADFLVKICSNFVWKLAVQKLHKIFHFYLTLSLEKSKVELQLRRSNHAHKSAVNPDLSFTQTLVSKKRKNTIKICLELFDRSSPRNETSD